MQHIPDNRGCLLCYSSDWRRADAIAAAYGDLCIPQWLNTVGWHTNVPRGQLVHVFLIYFLIIRGATHLSNSSNFVGDIRNCFWQYSWSNNFMSATKVWNSPLVFLSSNILRTQNLLLFFSSDSLRFIIRCLTKTSNSACLGKCGAQTWVEISVRYFSDRKFPVRKFSYGFFASGNPA